MLCLKLSYWAWTPAKSCKHPPPSSSLPSSSNSPRSQQFLHRINRIMCFNVNIKGTSVKYLCVKKGRRHTCLCDLLLCKPLRTSTCTTRIAPCSTPVLNKHVRNQATQNLLMVNAPIGVSGAPPWGAARSGAGLPPDPVGTRVIHSLSYIRDIQKGTPLQITKCCSR
jgi:hypothetical protein